MHLFLDVQVAASYILMECAVTNGEEALKRTDYISNAEEY